MAVLSEMRKTAGLYDGVLDAEGAIGMVGREWRRRGCPIHSQWELNLGEPIYLEGSFPSQYRQLERLRSTQYTFPQGDLRMHFYYLDEAGCTGCDLNNGEQPTFVLGGISVRDEGWNRTQQDLAEIVGAYFGGNVPDDFELHANELLSPNGEGPFQGHERAARNALALQVLGLLESRRHDVHLIALDKARIANSGAIDGLGYDCKIPYLVWYDYLVTYINWFVKEKLGRSARGMIILDAKPEFLENIEQITSARRFQGTTASRVKWVVEFSYPVDSRKNPMVQLSDLIVFCSKKFLEVEEGYRPNWSDQAKQFFAKCYDLIDSRFQRKGIVERDGRAFRQLNEYLETIRALPVGQWRRRYEL